MNSYLKFRPKIESQNQKESYWFFLILFFVFSCEKPSTPGFLEVKSPDSGIFEIYRMAGDPATQLVSEEVGNFNQDMPLKPGSYLILADCSHARVFIKPGEHISLTVHKVTFETPREPSLSDKFSIQCSRYEKFLFRQNLNNLYSFHILSGKRVLLVGMKSFHLNSDDFNSGETPMSFKFGLSGLMVKSPEVKVSKSPFFVSPSNSLVAITQPQNLGQWQYLIPGNYDVEINGTKEEFVLRANETLVITPAMVQIRTPKSLNSRPRSSVINSPTSIRINNDHLLKLNEITPILPGAAVINLSGSQEAIKIEAYEGQITNIQLKSVKIDLGCSPWEWSCLGGKEVLLFHEKQHYPYMQSYTDRDFLYAGDDVHVGFLSSRGIRYELPKRKASIELKVGKVKLIPEIVQSQKQITDLVRLEARGRPLSGHTLDIPASDQTVLTLIVGTYRLAQYNSLLSADGERWLKNKRVVIKAGETTEVRFPYYLTERKFKRLSKASKEREARRLRRLSRKYQHAAPARRF